MQDIKMNKEEIGENIVHFIKKQLLFSETRKIGEAESLLGTGVLDSTGILELISYIERSYQLKIADQELSAENFDSVQSIKTFISRKLAS